MSTIGTAVVIFFVIYLALFLSYRILGKSAEPILPVSDMPSLRPVPVATKNRTLFMRALVWIFDVRKWELENKWSLELKDGTIIVLHKGFQFDGASVPKPLWILLSPVGLLLIPGLIHDYGYRYQQLWQSDSNGSVTPFMQGADRAEWDDLFRGIGKEVNGSAIFDDLAWLAIRWFGGAAWRRRRKEAAKPILP